MVTVLIVTTPIVLFVALSAWMLIRARMRKTTPLLMIKVGSPIDEALANERFLHPYRYND